MSDEQIKYMVDRFLGWPLPADFSPDNGISVRRPNYHPAVHWQPTGTNLFDASQATNLMRHLMEGSPLQTERDAAVAEAARLRKALERAVTYVELSCDEAGGEEAEEARRDLALCNAALDRKVP